MEYLAKVLDEKEKSEKTVSQIGNIYRICVYYVHTLFYNDNCKEDGTMAVSVKKNRIDFRVDDKNKALLERAAQLKNLSLSAYITSVCLNQAKLDIEENETLVLSGKDADLVYQLLENAPEPNEALKELFK